MIDRNAPFREPDAAVCAMCDGTGVHECPGGAVSASPVQRTLPEAFSSLSDGVIFFVPGLVDASFFNERDWDRG